MQGVTFNVQGAGLPSAGKKFMTTASGQLILTGLSLDPTYTLTETAAKGYYLSGPIQFKLTRDLAGALQFTVVSGAFDNAAQISEPSNSAQAQVTVNLSNTPIPLYTLNLTKADKTNPAKTLAGAQFEISGPGITGTKIYTADSSGKIQIPNLYAYVAGKSIDGIYTIKEMYPPEGYALDSTPVQFRLTKGTDGNLTMEYISGAFDQAAANAQIDQTNKTVSVTMSDRSLFKITKTDGTTGELLPNVKFAIYAIDSSGNTSPAYDPNGNLVGSKETINGVTYNQILTTDANGEITDPLKPGMYKVVEVQTLDGYILPANETDRTYYFGIGAGQPATMGWQQMWSSSAVSGATYQSVIQTSDGGYVAVGAYYSSSSRTILGTQTVDGKDITLPITNPYDQIITKYNSNGKIEWIQITGGTTADYLYGVTETSNGGYIAVGYFNSTSITISGTQTANGTDITVTNNGGQDGIIIKYNSTGKVEYTQNCAAVRILYGVTSTSDGGYVVAGSVNTGIIPGTQTASGKDITTSSGGGIIKYDSNGKVEWVQRIQIGSSSGIQEGVITTSDGGYLSVGYNFSIVKYDSNHIIKWAYIIDDLASIYTTTGNLYGAIETSDGGYIAVGELGSASITISGTQTASGTDITVTNNGFQDGIIIKYNSAGKVEYVYTIAGASSDFLYGITATADGGYAVVGSMGSSVTIPGTQTVDGKDIILSSGQIIIKYNNNGKIEFAQNVGTGYSMYGISSSSDGGFTAVGNTGTIVRYQPVVLQPKVPEESELNVTNYKLTHAITTNVNGTGGTISGKGQSSYETVTDGEGSIKPIVITPDAGYTVTSITVNGEPIPYTAASNGTVTLPQFTNVTEDKNVVAAFAAGMGSVTVHHYLYKNGAPTTIELAPAATLTGKYTDATLGQTAEAYSTRAGFKPAWKIQISTVIAAE